MIRRIAVRGVILHESKLLCVRLKANQGNLAGDYWCLPGGGLEDGETLLAGIEREMIEESGVKPIIGNVLHVQQFVQGERDFLEFFFHIANSHDYLQIDLSKTTHGQKEIAEIGFVDPAAVTILPKFLASEKLDELVASNAPTKLFWE